MVIRVVIGASVITECAGGQCRAAADSHVRQSDPSPCVAGVGSRRRGTAASADSPSQAAPDADDKRPADIDRKLHAAADPGGIDATPTGGLRSQLLPRRRLLFLGRFMRISE
jgi:hypothetical protein